MTGDEACGALVKILTHAQILLIFQDSYNVYPTIYLYHTLYFKRSNSTIKAVYLQLKPSRHLGIEYLFLDVVSRNTQQVMQIN